MYLYNKYTQYKIIQNRQDSMVFFINDISKQALLRIVWKSFFSLSICFTIRIWRKIWQSSNKLEQFCHVYSSDSHVTDNTNPICTIVSVYLKKITIELKIHLIDVSIQFVDHNTSAIKVQFNLNANTVICSKI